MTLTRVDRSVNRRRRCICRGGTGGWSATNFRRVNWHRSGPGAPSRLIAIMPQAELSAFNISTQPPRLEQGARANVKGEHECAESKAVTRSHLPVGVRRLHSAADDQTAI